MKSEQNKDANFNGVSRINGLQIILKQEDIMNVITKKASIELSQLLDKALTCFHKGKL